ncbi:hypothetical protein DI53_1712 [Sphingobacterium deserti]|uniref:Uncharacterized protein n=1 Tax=Sphingobacterium deserti TaxID=1229276 RepID=A0A0B8T4H4_9SPHI|nr:hypothetical protein DI53_1712 [Sphingobacterium deserti]
MMYREDFMGEVSRAKIGKCLLCPRTRVLERCVFQKD